MNIELVLPKMRVKVILLLPGSAILGWPEFDGTGSHFEHHYANREDGTQNEAGYDNLNGVFGAKRSPSSENHLQRRLYP